MVKLVDTWDDSVLVKMWTHVLRGRFEPLSNLCVHFFARNMDTFQGALLESVHIVRKQSTYQVGLEHPYVVPWLQAVAIVGLLRKFLESTNSSLQDM